MNIYLGVSTTDPSKTDSEADQLFAIFGTQKEFVIISNWLVILGYI